MSTFEIKKDQSHAKPNWKPKKKSIMLIFFLFKRLIFFSSWFFFFFALVCHIHLTLVLHKIGQGMVQHRVALATLWSLEGTMWCLGGKGSAYIPVHLSGILNINITKKMQEKKRRQRRRRRRQRRMRKFQHWVILGNFHFFLLLNFSIFTDFLQSTVLHNRD